MNHFFPGSKTLLLQKLLPRSHHIVTISNFHSHCTYTVFQDVNTVIFRYSLHGNVITLSPPPFCHLFLLKSPSHQHEQPSLSTALCLEEKQTRSGAGSSPDTFHSSRAEHWLCCLVLLWEAGTELAVSRHLCFLPKTLKEP